MSGRMGHLATRLLRNDLRLIFRDRLLVGLVLVTLALGFACRFALPALDAGLAASGVMTGRDGTVRFRDTYPLWVAFVSLWQGALVSGVVFAFLLLDEKEDGTLQAMRVTPVPFRGYLLYRAALPYAMALGLILVLPSMIGLAVVPLRERAPIALVAALAAPVVTLSLASFAHDKVQGLALTKFTGIAGLAIIVGFFAPPVGRALLGIFPPFLVAQSYWLALASGSGTRGAVAWRLAVAAAVQLGLVALLLRRFRASR